MSADQPLFDPETGAVNWDVEMQRQKQIHLEREVNAGGDGGMGDNPGTPCQESIRNLSDQLYPSR